MCEVFGGLNLNAACSLTPLTGGSAWFNPIIFFLLPRLLLSNLLNPTRAQPPPPPNGAASPPSLPRARLSPPPSPVSAPFVSTADSPAALAAAASYSSPDTQPTPFPRLRLAVLRVIRIRTTEARVAVADVAEAEEGEEADAEGPRRAQRADWHRRSPPRRPPHPGDRNFPCL